MPSQSTQQALVVLVTGDSSGIGRACCELLSKRGRTVFGASRSEPTAVPWTHLHMDITDDTSAEEAIAAILASAGRLDAVVHCAGVSLMGAFEDTTPQEAADHFDVNYLGAVRVMRSALPAMRRQQSGKLLIVGSIGGLIGLRYLGHYCAAKSALDRLIEAMRPELSEFGIEATIIHPGDFNTKLSSNCTNAAAAESDRSPYLDEFSNYSEFYKQCEADGLSPDILAQRIDRLLERKRLPARAIVGTRLETIGVMAKRLIPTRLFETCLSIIYRP